ncbi:hypothetical protein RI129_009486 [Pyrocoelia pectoralis]|uniref:Uncharacterized protein n=1 Tax=Pyrocoelia pectoralis TaxID=417401 RepID=A0AAN7VCM5_9COLE
MASSRSPDEFQNFQFAASVRESLRSQLSPITPSPQSGDVKVEGKNADKEEGLDNIYEYLDEGWFPSPLHIVSEAMGKFKELEEKYQQKLEENQKLIACLEWKLKILKTRNLYAKNNLKTIDLIFNKWKSAVKSVYEY